MSGGFDLVVLTVSLGSKKFPRFEGSGFELVIEINRIKCGLNAGGELGGGGGGGGRGVVKTLVASVPFWSQFFHFRH